MNCADIEILLADYVDGTIRGGQKSAVERHLAECPECAELARDAAGAVAFIGRSAVIEAPPELVTRILFEITDGPSRSEIKPGWIKRIFGARLQPLLQPKFTMGLAMTILSFAMLGRLSGIEVRQLKPSDLDPVKVWAAAEDRVHRGWERTMKYYENLKVVFEIQTRIREWNDQAEPSSASPDTKKQ